MIFNLIHNKAWQRILFITLLSVFSLHTQAAIPDNVDYQGYLTDSGCSNLDTHHNGYSESTLAII